MADELVFEIVKGKTLPALVLRVEDQNGAIIPLNDYSSPTAAFCTLEGSPIILGGSMSIDGPDALVQYNWVAADTDVAGQYLMRVTIVHTDSGKEMALPNGGVPIRISISEEC